MVFFSIIILSQNFKNTLFLNTPLTDWQQSDSFFLSASGPKKIWFIFLDRNNPPFKLLLLPTFFLVVLDVVLEDATRVYKTAGYPAWLLELKNQNLGFFFKI
jgi:hypothetical protein